MKKLLGLVAAIALLVTATTASAAQVFVYNGSSAAIPPAQGTPLCFLVGCSAGSVAGDVRLTLVLGNVEERPHLPVVELKRAA